MNQNIKNSAFILLMGFIFVIGYDSVGNVLNDASQISLDKAQFGRDKSFENALRNDLSYELEKRDWVTWGNNYNLDLKEKIKYGNIVDPTNNLN